MHGERAIPTKMYVSSRSYVKSALTIPAESPDPAPIGVLNVIVPIALFPPHL